MVIRYLLYFYFAVFSVTRQGRDTYKFTICQTKLRFSTHLFQYLSITFNLKRALEIHVYTYIQYYKNEKINIFYFSDEHFSYASVN